KKEATGVIVQGGKRRGANMGILRCDHPDIFDFVEAKQDETAFSNFNFSVGVTDEFMEAVRENKYFNLINPRTQGKVKSIRAKSLFDLITYTAWRSGDPGLVFLDEINRTHPVPGIGKIEATNPCGEVPLLPFESCNLASINLSHFVKDQSVDWMKLKNTVEWGVRFLDNVIEVNKFPLSEIQKITQGNRKIGLGVMGFADMLIKMGIPYTSERALTVASKVMRFIRQNSLKASQELAEERGAFPNLEKSMYAQQGIQIRNGTVNTIAPTGTISLIAGCSSSIEPLFALSYVRNVLSGTKMFEIHPIFEKEIQKRGLYSKELMGKIGKSGSIKNIPELPEELKDLFITSFDVSPEMHLRVQAAFQKYTDNSVSKTINLPQDATVEDISHIYLRAHELKCKGITIYRYGTKKDQVLSFGSSVEQEKNKEGKFLTADPEYSGGCQSGVCPF
ncbi:adenosylcobalamin-dependent ribonucleoside-diphosphate reductase, partial [bacterium]|nr:adenosylcobalamin-dependent ribonucleoside-diphosphate reductase [bacterium]